MGRILVTGGCGFIGSHVCDRLVALGHPVRVLDDLSTGHRHNLPAGAELWEGSVADPGTVAAAMAGISGCVHLAAIASVRRSVEDWIGTNEVNLRGSIAVFEAARREGGVPVVYASSAAVYGDNPALPLDETAALGPLSAYGVDKLASEYHAAIAARLHGVPTTGFRFFNVFGPRQDPGSPYSGVISIFARRLLDGQPVSVFGDGSQSRDFVYVADVVDHLIAALDHPAREPRCFNVCTGRAVTVLELIETLGQLIGVSPEIRFEPPRAGDILHSLGVPRRARDELGVWARTSLRDGLRPTIAALRDGMPSAGA